MPMFPLGSVLFPYAILPLHVFEPRYRVMTRRCLDGDREFGVVLIERGSEVGGGDARFDTGTVARIVQISEMAGGRFALATVGLRRFRVARWLTDDPFPRADIDVLEEAAPGPEDATARDAVRDAFGIVLDLWHRIDERVPAAPPPASDDPVRDVYEIAATAPIGLLDAQRVLEAGDTIARSALLRQYLGELAEDLRARLAE
jgi:Lon protease-like protein